jgi:hypothetical protein
MASPLTRYAQQLLISPQSLNGCSTRPPLQRGSRAVWVVPSLILLPQKNVPEASDGPGPRLVRSPRRAHTVPVTKVHCQCQPEWHAHWQAAVAFNASGPGRLRAESRSDAGATSRKDGIAENVTRHGGGLGLGARPFKLPLAVQSPRRDAHCRLRLAVCIQVEPWAPASQSPCGCGPSHWHCQLGTRSLLVAGHGTPDGNRGWARRPGDDPPGRSDHAESPGGKSGVVVGVHGPPIPGKSGIGSGDGPSIVGACRAAALSATVGTRMGPCLASVAVIMITRGRRVRRRHNDIRFRFRMLMLSAGLMLQCQLTAPNLVLMSSAATFFAS